VDCFLGGNVRLLHLVMNWRPSLTNSRGISRNSFAWSIVGVVLCVWVCGVERRVRVEFRVSWVVCRVCVVFGFVVVVYVQQ
jgi:hypothetical protein